MSSRPDLKAALLATGLWCLCGASLFIALHNYALNLLPSFYQQFDAPFIQADQAGSGLTYTFKFDRSEPDGPYHRRSRVILFENGNPWPVHGSVVTARRVGLGNWAHEADRIIFSAGDNSDPRTNGRSYDVSHPVLYHHWIGRSALLLFGVSVAGLYRIGRRITPPAPVLPEKAGLRRWRMHVSGATGLLVLGLYFSTGTMSPYAITAIAQAAPANGYLYNPDHLHFRALFDFVDGKDPSTWHDALLLRRILYNLLAYPFMKAAGWEIGGTVAGMVFNVVAFIVFVRALRRRVGGRGAIFAAWALALYPGAAYWAGLPYLYALIVPLSLMLMLALIAIADDPGWRPVVLGSLAIGLMNLGYDFFVFSLPASLLLLLWQRRWIAMVVAAALQATPLIVWLLVLKHHFGQGLANSNSGAFSAIAGAYLKNPDFDRWRTVLAAVPDIGADVFFGSNFIFLPILFLAAVAVNPLTSRIKFHPAELALLAAGLLLFLFNNLAPDYESAWQMRGTWIARLYQPIFPALIYFCARWFQHLPPVGRRLRAGLWLSGGLIATGNALILFGPVLMNPLKISEDAFYRFYDHANHANYENNLNAHGRRPLGFPRPEKP